MTALVPVLIGVQAGRGLTDALGHGYPPAMIILAGLCVVAAVISAIYVQDGRTGDPGQAGASESASRRADTERTGSRTVSADLESVHMEQATEEPRGRAAA
jgi:hypothetical protein